MKNPMDSLRSSIALLRDPAGAELPFDLSDWPEVKKNAMRQGLAPVIASIVRNRLPAAEQAWCDETAMRSWVRHEHRLESLGLIAKALRSARIPFVALKGPLLARRHYSPPFLRKPSIDLDIGISRNNLDEACRTLGALGYSVVSGGEARAVSHHVVLEHPRMPRVEVHFRLSHGARGIPVDKVIERAVLYCMPDGTEVYVPEPADEILQLMLHLASDRFSNLFHLYELWKICRASRREVLQTAVDRALAHRFSAVAALTDIAFRTVWQEPFLPEGYILPGTWLGRRVNSRLFEQFLGIMAEERRLTLRRRLRGRWLDFQTTDTLTDAIASITLVVRVAAYSFWHRRWSEVIVKG